MPDNQKCSLIEEQTASRGDQRHCAGELQGENRPDYRLQRGIRRHYLVGYGSTYTSLREEANISDQRLLVRYGPNVKRVI
jgi:hypothetical protein